jgi:hypothetical protein
VFPPEIIPEPFHIGDRVYVGGYGPMAGHEGVYDGRSDGGKLRLYFAWLTTPHPQLDGRCALDCTFDEVMAIIDRLRTGAFL